MNIPFNFRPLLAAAVLLAVLAGAYQAAVRGPLITLEPGTVRPANLLAGAGSRAEDSAARAAAPLPTLAGPAAPDRADSLAEAKAKAASQRTYDSLARAYHARLRECPPKPLRFRETRRDPPAPRRYVGTVGGQPATAELSWVRPDSVVGRVYFWRSGAEYSLASHHSARVLALRPEYLTSHAGGRWHLTRPPGPVLQGYWADSAGRRGPPFVLRENYQGGVRYETRTLTLTGGQPNSPNPCNVPAYSRDFLHLLGPAASRPPLSRVQWPSLPARRRQLRADYNPEVIYSRSIDVRLNDFQLLSYQEHALDDPFEGSSSFTLTNTLVDLATGRVLTITSQLLPRQELPLRRLLTTLLLHDEYFLHNSGGYRDGWTWVADHGQRVQLAPLPHGWDEKGDGEIWGDGFTLTPHGLEVQYDYPNDYGVLIPYPELRPLVRPGTPLARMLRARGLW